MADTVAELVPVGGAPNVPGAPSPIEGAPKSAIEVALDKLRAGVAAGQIKGDDKNTDDPDDAPVEEPAKEPTEGAKPDEKPLEKPLEAKEDEEKPVVVTLKGIEGRPDIEIEVEDQAAADRLNELQNNGMRKSEWTKKLETLEGREAELKAVESMIEVAPSQFILKHAPKEAQLEIARSLLAQHFDELVPDLAKWVDPTTGAVARREFAADQRDKADEASKKWQRQQVIDRQTLAITRAVANLIPDGTSEDDTRLFITLAESEIVRSINKGLAVTPKDVPDLLKGIISRFRFTAEAAPKEIAPVVPPTNGATPAPATPRNADDRLKKAAKARAIARRVSPQGAGGMPAQVPKMPQTVNGKNAIHERVKWLREHPGMLRTTDG
jgi:hypothetical protein